MAVCFAIQIFGYGSDFDARAGYTVLWDENQGPVFIGYPIRGGFTVYKWGDTAMQASASTGLPNRIISLNEGVAPISNYNKLNSARANPLSFDIRETGAGGETGLFYNYVIGGFAPVEFYNASGSNGQIARPDATSAKVSANTSPGTKYDLFQQSYRSR